MFDVLQLITDTDRRGAQIAAIELDDALRSLGTTVRTAALQAGTNAVRLDVELVGSPFAARGAIAVREAARDARVVLSQGGRTLWAGVVGTAGRDRSFVYRSIGDLSVWASGTRRARVAWALRRAAAVVVLWPGAVAAVRDRFGVPEERIEVIPQGAPAARFPLITPDARAAARAALGIEGDRPVALHLGALSEEKRVTLAIDAATRAGVDLLVAGDGPERAVVEAHAGPGIHVLGAVDDPRTVLAAADVLVVASRTEGIPGAIVEAGLSGLPVVATAVGGVPSLVSDGETGVLVEPGDVVALAAGIERALATPAMGACARERCLASFTLDALAPRWRVVLERAMCA